MDQGVKPRFPTLLARSMCHGQWGSSQRHSKCHSPASEGVVHPDGRGHDCKFLGSSLTFETSSSPHQSLVCLFYFPRMRADDVTRRSAIKLPRLAGPQMPLFAGCASRQMAQQPDRPAAGEASLCKVPRLAASVACQIMHVVHADCAGLQEALSCSELPQCLPRSLPFRRLCSAHATQITSDRNRCQHMQTYFNEMRRMQATDASRSRVRDFSGHATLARVSKLPVQR
jgi:hypothetical protein